MYYSTLINGAPRAQAAMASSAPATPLPENACELTASEAAALIGSGAMTSRQLVEAILARIDAHHRLNAFIEVDPAGALAKAQAYDDYLAAGGACLPMGGVPIAIKDNIQVKGFANTAGTRGLAHFRPNRNATIVDRLEAAGAIIVGKTNMHELAYGTSGYNTAFHVPGVVGVRNAYDFNCVAGGSSSGNGSAVGARLIPLALGTDTGGSIRQPCALNGCVGFRPTVGRYSQDGIVPVSPTRDTAGPMARSVEDLILMDQVITGLAAVSPPKPAEIRLGVVEQFWEDLSPEVAQQCRKALQRLEKAGVQLVPVSLPGIHELNTRISMPIALYEGRDALESYLQLSETGITLDAVVAQICSPDVKALFEAFIMPRKLPAPGGGVVDLATAYQWAMSTGRPQMIGEYRTLMQANQLHALVFPTTLDQALASNADATTFAAFARMIRNVDPGSNAGLPGISLPVGLQTPRSLPVGLEIDGLPETDGQLLAIAQTLQGILGRQDGPLATLTSAPQ